MTLTPSIDDPPRGALAPSGRTLVAGVGNVLRGDDGFGVIALRSLRERLGEAQELGLATYEAGIAGVGLVQELMDGFDTLIVLDAVRRPGARPGTVFVLEPDLDEVRENGYPVDPHLADCDGVLVLAAAAGALPRRVFVVGCQVDDVDVLDAPLSPAVARAVPVAVTEVCSLLGLRLDDPSLREISRADA